jgi:hypothetical protein
MLNLLLAVLVPFLITTAEEQTASNIEVVEIFRAETTEELEASLTDGYPMPWLEEILNDESIPEEDRYWLDCRVRAVIAQDLHLFFDEEGDPVRIEAGYILPGEDYWRESFIVNLPGNEPVPNSPEGRWAGRGLIVDYFGNEIGEIAISNTHSQLSRDGSVGVTQSGIQSSNFGPGLMNLCFFYPDGNFIEFPIHHNTIHETVSQSGELVAASCIDRRRNEEKIHKLYVFDGNANLLWERILEYSPPSGLISPTISPDDRYLAVQIRNRLGRHYPVILYDTKTGEELHRWNLTLGNHLNFSPDSRFLCLAGRGAGVVVDCESGEVVWSRFLEYTNNVHNMSEIEKVRELFCTNGADIIYWYARKTNPTVFWTMLTERSGQSIINIQTTGRPAISPDGQMCVVRPYQISPSENSIIYGFQVVILRDGE